MCLPKARAADPLAVVPSLVPTEPLAGTGDTSLICINIWNYLVIP
jgi:hypothetical protein